MCGINFYINEYSTNNKSNALHHRGPDNFKMFKDEFVTMEFNRLKINDLTEVGDQPLLINDCVLICNGEIFNHHELKLKYNFDCKSKSDCEVIIHLYVMLKKQKNNIYDIIHTLCDNLDGEFAFCLYDIKQKFVIVSRDPYGVRPLFYDSKRFSFASEMKAFIKHTNVQQFPPGSFVLISDYTSMSYVFPYRSLCNNIYTYESDEDILQKINVLFTNAVKKRIMSERSVCALLSGGLDSSLVASLVSREMKLNKLKTFSIGLEGSPDLYYAQKVADFIQSEHTSIIVTKDDFLNCIEEVIKTIESYDTTTVRASVGNYLVSKYIANNSDCVVVFNGDYSDEVCGGYKYFKNCRDSELFHEECCRLVKDICFFDSLRSDRSISANGLEARVPFADKDFVSYYLSIHPALRMSCDRIEKYLLRKAFEKENLLPMEVLWREKEAFSDGVSKSTNSWADILRQYIDEQISNEEFEIENKNNFVLKETYFYHKIFKKYYGNDHVIPYLWMPKFCGDNIIDPSARKLEC